MVIPVEKGEKKLVAGLQGANTGKREGTYKLGADTYFGSSHLCLTQIKT